MENIAQIQAFYIVFTKRTQFSALFSCQYDILLRFLFFRYTAERDLFFRYSVERDLPISEKLV